MKSTTVMLTLCLFFLLCSVTTADVVVSSFSNNGTITWDSEEGQTYRIEWASDLSLADWTDLEQGFQAFHGANGTAELHVPMFYRIISLGVPPTNMAYIPSGRFYRGDLKDNRIAENPVSSVYVTGFYIDRHLVTQALWDSVRSWALTNGYSFSAGSANETKPSRSWNKLV